MANNESTAVSHTNSVKDIVKAARNAYNALLNLQAADDINPDSVFINESSRDSQHPQKAAHAHVLGYHYQLAKKTYWIKAKDYWQSPIEDDSGTAYKVTVPDGDDFHVEKDHPSDPINLTDIDTTTEDLRLETLSHRWSFRTVTVTYKTTSPYRETDTLTTDEKRVWLPPRGSQLVFEQLENVRSKIGLAADVDEPSWRSDEPI